MSTTQPRKIRAVRAQSSRPKSLSTKKGFLSWAIEHIRPSVEFPHTSQDEEYWARHGGKPGVGDIDDWAEYAKNNATFWVKIGFQF